jgi:predicted DNA-binding transcriptional regulator AlpA
MTIENVEAQLLEIAERLHATSDLTKLSDAEFENRIGEVGDKSAAYFELMKTRARADRPHVERLLAMNRVMQLIVRDELGLGHNGVAAVTEARSPLRPEAFPSDQPERRPLTVSVREAARMIGISDAWMYRHQDELPFIVKRGRLIRCSVEGIERWIRDNSQVLYDLRRGSEHAVRHAG